MERSITAFRKTVKDGFLETKSQIPSVNFHLWEPCNMRCKFCFATFQDVKQSILPKGHLPREQAVQVVQQLANFGFQKITFAGGEPTLCKWLPDLIATAKEAGMTTMIVSNGSRLTNEFLEINKNKLDWIAISIDSLNTATNLTIGRAISNRSPLQLDDYKSLIDRVKQFSYGLKINTVVNRMNFNENMNEFIRYAEPKRWKILQVLPMVGQNDNKINDFKISEAEFQIFIRNHEKLQDITNIIPETNSQIKGSYVMVDPAGRFFDNAKGTHNYSRQILEVGVETAIQEMNYDLQKFILRGGQYDWTQVKVKKF
jgi:radical S-adenosyl methionine domain-containing protein 2